MSDEVLRRTLVVSNEGGLHAGPASRVVQTVGEFDAEVRLCSGGGVSVDARSILSLLTLGLVRGTKVELVCRGREAAAVLEALSELFEAGFNE